MAYFLGKLQQFTRVFISADHRNWPMEEAKCSLICFESVTQNMTLVTSAPRSDFVS